MTFLLVCVCGGLGTVARFMLTTSIHRMWNRAFPVSTLVINILATFCAGVAAAAYAYHTVDHYTYLLFVTGFLGGFSTFSTAINEAASLARTKRITMAGSYVALTVLLPIVCATLGWGLVAITR